MNVGGLFSGIGGWELGLERAGFDIAWHCESDPFCRRVLGLRWPGVPCYDDVRRLVGHADGAPSDAHAAQSAPRAAVGEHGDERGVPVQVPPVDVLCGGFPCQDISLAGAGAGINGSRSGLWGEFARLIGDLRPRYVLVENVAALTARGLDRVLGDLAARGFDAEWDCLPASAFGAPHRRDRLWLVAYPGSTRRREDAGGAHGDEAADAGRAEEDDHVAVGAGTQRLPAGGRDTGLADAQDERSKLRAAQGERLGRPSGSSLERQWAVEPDVGRVANGIPARVDRLRSLGNALVPQISEWIGRRILEWEAVNP